MRELKEKRLVGDELGRSIMTFMHRNAIPKPVTLSANLK